MLIGFSLHVHSLYANKLDAISAVENPHSTGSHESESLIKVKNITGSILLLTYYSISSGTTYRN
jgi:hypothetical protein